MVVGELARSNYATKIKRTRSGVWFIATCTLPLVLLTRCGLNGQAEIARQRQKHGKCCSKYFILITELNVLSRDSDGKLNFIQL